MPKFEFFAISDIAIIPPEPMIKHLPDWYKNLEAYIGGKKGVPFQETGHSTMKKCIPVLDALSAGYMMFTQVDFITEYRKGVRHWWWAANAEPHKDLITNHSIESVAGHPKIISDSIPWKMESPWGIRTPKGWSTLFMPPLYQDNPIFEIFTGLVDTDTYRVPVNHPFYLMDEDFEGTIPCGTPLAQIIPVKRENWEIKIINSEKEKNAILRENTHRSRYFWNGYKKLFWSPKSYK
jgi:hypothetical protein